MREKGCLAWIRTRTSGVRDRHAADYATRQMVAREGSAPPISGCRPDVILFHHRAEIGCLAWIRTRTGHSERARGPMFLKSTRREQRPASPGQRLAVQLHLK